MTITMERLNNASILVVDDVEVNRAILMGSLKKRGYTNILVAKDGAEALRITYEEKPDLVILDIVMPSMDGFSYCKAIRRDPAFDNMPILVQTMLEKMEDKLKAFHLGASDYICKPINPDELSARTQVHLMKKLLVEDLHNYQLRTDAEMQAAKSMQARLMPDEHMIAMCERMFDMKIAAHVETSSLLGGDSWGIRPLSDTKLAIYSYDFSGHGVSAAMNVFRIHTVMQECAYASADPGHFLGQLSKRLHPLLERNQFATMFYAVIDTDANCLLYAAAAAPSPILFTQADQNCALLDASGFPLGAISNAAYQTHSIAFMPNDLLLFASDCLIESKNSEGELLCEEAIAECVSDTMYKNMMNPARSCLDGILSKFRNHTSAPIGDDLTISTFWRCKS